MVKLTGITAVGLYAHPWVEYAVAAVYNVVDEFIIVNAGFNSDLEALMKELKEKGRSSQDDFPLERESKALREIDVNGKIYETNDVYWDKPAKGVDRNKPRAYWGVRKGWDSIPARNFTIANRIAIDKGADWILVFDADQVFYENARLIPSYIAKHPSCAYQFVEHKGWKFDIYHRKKNSPSTPSDGTKLYRTHPGDCYIGAGSPMIQPGTSGGAVYDVSTAHLKHAYPSDWSLERERAHIYERYYKAFYVTWHLGERVGKPADWAEKMRSQEQFDAFIDDFVKRLLAIETEPADIPPPLVSKIGALKYIQEGHPK